MEINPLIIKSLQVFLELSQAKNISEAAKALKMSTAAISQHLAQVEELFDTTLFNRETRPMQLTTAGKFLVTESRKLIHHAESMQHFLSQSHQFFQLNIGIVNTLAQSISIEFLKYIKQIVVTPTLTIATTPSLHQGFKEGRIGVMLCSEELTSYGDYVSKVIYKEPMIVMYPKKIIKGKINLQQLAQRLPYISLPSNSLLGFQISSFFNLYKIKTTHLVRVSGTYNPLDIVNEGLGWTINVPLYLNHIPDSVRYGIGYFAIPGANLNRTVYFVAKKEFMNDEIMTLPKMVNQWIQHYYQHQMPDVYEAIKDQLEFNF